MRLSPFYQAARLRLGTEENVERDAEDSKKVDADERARRGSLLRAPREQMEDE